MGDCERAHMLLSKKRTFPVARTISVPVAALLLLASCGERGGFFDDARNVPERALASGRESTVQLPAPAPVRLPYRAAYVEVGKMAFRADPDGWDGRLARALGSVSRCAGGSSDASRRPQTLKCRAGPSRRPWKIGNGWRIRA